MESKQRISLLAVTLIVLLHSTTSSKSSARPVYEVINEQARIDDNIKISNGPGVLPYGNPLAGNSKQNARIHINNQQAMYNAEKVRQHRAQLQRLAQGGPRLDSYMRAYHESQDNHQLALEQQQATVLDTVTKPTPSRTQNISSKHKSVNSTSKKRTQMIPENNSRATSNVNQRQETLRKTHSSRKTDASKSMKPRSQRSYGTVEYQQYLNPQRYQFLYVDPKKLQEQDVTIKPNGNIGVTQQETTESSKLYTEAIPSDTKFVYPKQYSQMQNYKTINEAEESDLHTKNNGELSEFTSSQNINSNNVPIDYYFYLKNPSHSDAELYDQSQLAQVGNTYASSYMTDYTVKDHTPITEDIDDIEDPNKNYQKPLTPEPSPTPVPNDETTTIQTNHYYKIEVASQTLTSKHKPDKTKEVLYYKQEIDPLYQALHYPSNPTHQTNDNGETNLHHNAQNVGIQHLTEEGVGVSAYGEDDVSINKSVKVNIRYKRSGLDNKAFLLPDDNDPGEIMTSTDAPSSEPLIRLNPALHKYNHNNLNVFVTPNVPIGNSDDDYLHGEEESDTFYDEYNELFYDDSVNDGIGVNTNIRPLINVDSNYHLDSHGSYAHNYKYFKRNPVYGISKYHRRIPQARPSRYHSVYDHLNNNDRYNLPLRYGLPRVNTLSNIDDLMEPVYMITQSELKQLMNNQKFNIEHVDVFQIPKQNKPKRIPHFTKYNKRYQYNRYRNHKLRNKLHKLNHFF